MSPDHITAGAYNRDIDKRLAHIWFGYVRLVVTMAVKVLHNTRNMCIHDLLNMNALRFWAYISYNDLQLCMCVVLLCDPYLYYIIIYFDNGRWYWYMITFNLSSSEVLVVIGDRQNTFHCGGADTVHENWQWQH